MGFITNHLINNYRFNQIMVLKSRQLKLDIDKYTCVKRIGEIHYLFYSEEMKHFDIAIRYDKPKGKAGGGFDEFKKVMLPKIIYTEQDADQLLQGILN